MTLLIYKMNELKKISFLMKYKKVITEVKIFLVKNGVQRIFQMMSWIYLYQFGTQILFI